MFQKELQKKLLNLYESENNVLHISGLWGSVRAYVGYQCLRNYPGFVLFCTPTQSEADRFYSDLLFFTDSDFFENGAAKPAERPPSRSSYHDNVKEVSSRYHEQIVLLPAWEILPLETMSPYSAIMNQRIHSLVSLVQGSLKGMVTTVDALMKKTLPVQNLLDNSLHIELSGELDRDKCVDHLHNIGYNRVDIVEDIGDFAVRGGVIDIFVPSYANPVRIELIGDEVESIREFEIDSQRSLSQVLEVSVLPVREIIYSKDVIEAALTRLQQIHISLSQRLPALDILRDKIERRVFFNGIEWYQPLMYRELESVFSLLPEKTLIVVLDESHVQQKIHDHETRIHGQFKHYQANQYPFFPQSSFYLSENDLIGAMKNHPRIIQTLFARDDDHEVVTEHIDLRPQSIPHFRGKIEGLFKFLGPYFDSDSSITILARNEVERKILLDAITDAESDEEETLLPKVIRSPLRILSGNLSQGFLIPEFQEIIISGQEIFFEKVKQRKSRRYRGEELISSFRDLKIGDYVVHIDNGIGRYIGTEEIAVSDIMRDFLIIEYADNDKLFLPMERINMIQRYSSADNAVKITLDKLGSSRWEKVKAKVKKSIQQFAHELLELYAAREVLSGFRAMPDDHLQQEFDASFPFEETDDQLQAINDVKEDMEQEAPMDRLVCGDVGFGKTEVALRAAFKAVLNNMQVAVIAPTTILAQQHFLTFKERFEPFPVRVEVISRFRTPKEQKEIINDLAEGKVDILIGTHRVLQKDVAFKNLGFIVIDEEHRFGVTHKERLKQLRKKADVLTLTATPIPRTLHMSISGLRDMSIINTPPENRLPILTEVVKFNSQTIRDAITREVHRGGQVYFVHNRVRTIYSLVTYLQRILPGISFGVAHGQMKERELKDVMDRFLAKDYDVLVSTTIIESGIDIPSVNTMLINRADKLGLAQLYQLRGRVGRSHRRAYCYLLIPSPRLLTKIAQKRLQVIQELTDLGSGFRIAAHDLEIRGAGNLLGAQQHGHVTAIGFDLYCSMLEQTVRELKGEKQQLNIDTQVTVPLEAFIPKTFVPDTNQRLMLYRKLASIKDQIQLNEFEDEMRDRFGTLPIVVQRLLKLKGFTLECNVLGIEKLEISPRTCIISFSSQIEYDIDELLSLLKDSDWKISFPGPHAIKIVLPAQSIQEIFVRIHKLIKLLKQRKNQFILEGSADE